MGWPRSQRAFSSSAQPLSSPRPVLSPAVPRDVDTGLLCSAAVVLGGKASTGGPGTCPVLHWAAKDSERCLQPRAARQQESGYPGVVLCSPCAGTSPGPVLGCCHHKRAHGRHKALPCSSVRGSAGSELAAVPAPRAGPTASWCPAPSLQEAPVFSLFSYFPLFLLLSLGKAPRRRK